MVVKGIKASMQKKVLEQALSYLDGDPKKNIPRLMDLADKVMPHDYYINQRAAMRKSIESKDNWYRYIVKLFELDKGVRDTFFRNVIYNDSIVGTEIQNTLSEKYNCNIPWAVLLDPTSACNMHCIGCWAAEYGDHWNLSLETIDRIIREGKELGTHMYIYTGGEPMVRKADLIRLCEMHPDCEFLAFTNGTLIDEAFCKEMLRVKNFVPAISLEGFEEANDGRRGEGVFDAVQRAMKLLKTHGLPFGISVCYTSANWQDVSSEEFFDLMIDSGAFFTWFFHYMPVGQDAVTDLLPSPEQREAVMKRIREFRRTKPLFTLDFQNDAQYVGGCIAGGRRYLHINAKGDVEPCVFIHYSNVNIHDVSLLDALRSPIFQAYHDNQPFNDNMLKPCPMLENPGVLGELVKKTGAENTDYQAKETPEELAAKCGPYAVNWTPTAERLWSEVKK